MCTLEVLYRNRLIETLIMKENATSLTNSSPAVSVGNRGQLLFLLHHFSLLLLPVCCNYNESHDAMKINEPVGASPSNNLKSWNNEISTKSTVHNSNTGANKTQTKQSKRL